MTPGSYTGDDILYGQTGARSFLAHQAALSGLDCFSTALAGGYFEDYKDWSGCTRWLANVGHLPLEMLPEINHWRPGSEATIRTETLIDDVVRRNGFSQNARGVGGRSRSFWHLSEPCEINRNYDQKKGKVSIAMAQQPDHPRFFTQSAYLKAVEYLAGGGGEWRLVEGKRLYYLLEKEADELVRGGITQLSITG